MTIENTPVDVALKDLLQKNIKLQFKNKLFKQGKLLLYKQNNYFLTLTLLNSKKGQIKFEIPIPFDVEDCSDDRLFYFDYRLSALSRRKENLLKELREVKYIKESKFYDSIMEILVLPDGPPV